MFVRSVLADKSPKPNRRAGAKKSAGTRFRSGNGLKGTVTGGKIPHKGTGSGAAEKNGLPAMITPWKVIFASVLIGVCGILYISHVFTTQQTLREVQRLEMEYNRIKRIHDARRLEYYRMVGPKEIYQKAREQGFINAGPADQLLILKK